VPNDGRALRDNVGGISLTWIGHATALIQAGGMSILTDPIFSETISGFFRRLAPPGVLGWLLPRIDVVVISHNHRDHLDEDSVVALGPRTVYVVPLGMAPWFRRRGLWRVIELDWWETTEIPGPRGGRAVITMVPAQHWSTRELTDRNKSLWGGYVIDAGGRRFYFAGDTGYPAAFEQIGARFPDLDYALLPIGAYEPRWFMKPQHMSPEEAAQAFRELGARTLVPIHWGTFHLTDEPMAEPPRRLRAALGDDADRILELAIGESWFEPPPEAPVLDAGEIVDAGDAIDAGATSAPATPAGD
jgi:L-ascorbate metabolism protein UlaG (beta-lactamase superfamily)